MQQAALSVQQQPDQLPPMPLPDPPAPQPPPAPPPPPQVERQAPVPPQALSQQAASMSPSQNPLLNQYPIEPQANSRFPGPDVQSQQVPESVAMRQPAMGGNPAAMAGQPPSWLGQAKSNIGAMQAVQPHPTGMPPEQGAFGAQPGGQPPPPEPPQYPGASYRDSIASMMTPQPGQEGGPPQNPMMAGQTPARMPSSLPGLMNPMSTAVAGSPPEAAQNRPIVMRDIEPGPRMAPGAQLAQGPVQAPFPRSGEGARPVVQISERVLGAGDPVKPTVPPPDLGRQPLGVPVEEQFEKSRYYQPPPMPPPKTKWQVDTELKRDQARNPVERTSYENQLAAEEKRRKDTHEMALKTWETRNTIGKEEHQKELERRRYPGREEADALKLGYEQQERAMKANELQRFGVSGRGPHEKALTEARKNVEGIAPMMRTLTKIDQTLKDNTMFTGAAANFNTTRAKIMHMMGWPLDKKLPDTEQFVANLAPLVAQARREVTGNANVSDKDTALSLRNAMADPTLERETLLEAFSDIRKAALIKAVGHQAAVRNYSTGDTEEQTRHNYNTLGVPGYVDIIPQAHVDVVRDAAAKKDQATLDEFDDDYNWPGLHLEVLKRRK